MPRLGLTREAVVDAAAALADAEGFDALTTTALARRLGVRPPSLYGHVASTDDLRRAVAALALDESADLVAAAVAGRAGPDALTGLADAHRTYARRRPGCSQATASDVGDHAAALAAGRRHADLTLAVLRGYPVPEDERAHAVRLVGAVVRGFVDLERAAAFSHSSPGTDTSWRRALAALDLALRAWPDLAADPLPTPTDPQEHP